MEQCEAPQRQSSRVFRSAKRLRNRSSPIFCKNNDLQFLVQTGHLHEKKTINRKACHKYESSAIKILNKVIGKI